MLGPEEERLSVGREGQHGHSGSRMEPVWGTRGVRACVCMHMCMCVHVCADPRMETPSTFGREDEALLICPHIVAAMMKN